MNSFAISSASLIRSAVSRAAVPVSRAAPKQAVVAVKTAAATLQATSSRRAFSSSEFALKGKNDASQTSSSSSSDAADGTSHSSAVLPHIELGPTHPSRYRDHYERTVAEDLMYMSYDPRQPTTSSSSVVEAEANIPIGAEEDVTFLSLDGEDVNPYVANRPTPPPRGNRPVRPQTPTVDPSTGTIPRLESIILHTMVKESIGSKPNLLSAIMAFRAISGETLLGGGRRGSSGVQIVRSKKGAAAFKLRQGMPVAVKVELKGEAMYDFLQTLVDFVLPRVRDFTGIPLPPASASKRSPSATSGVVSFGLESNAMALFPQIGVNLDAYPRTHGFHVHVLTNCKGSDAQMRARALLSGFRVPFVRRSEVKA